LSRFDGAAFKNYSFDQGFGEIGVHGLLADPEGNVWVSSVPGVLRLRPSSMHRSMTQPPVFITSVQVDQEPLDPNRSYELGPDRAVISFRFAGLSFTDEQNVRYRYRLLGFDREWSPPVTTREIRYTHLPGGTYEFEVLARSGDGIWDEEPARFAFTVLPPLWARWWFILLVLGTLAALTYLSYRYRLAKALELERTRSRIAMDLHDDIGSSLTRVSIMAEVARRQAAVDPAAVESSLARIGDTARELIDALSDIVWSVDPRHDDLLNVIRRIVQFGQEVCEGRGIGFETDLSGSFGSARLSPEQRRDIYLVFKEGIHNVVKHSGATRARFRVHPTGRGALLELLDDGAGIPDDAEGTGHGLISLRERGNRAGCAFSMTSKPGEGTRIALEVKTA
jgi:signal transduction histidine kinase